MSVSAGWYADPQDPQLLRYFDGTSWTTQTRPLPTAPTQAGQAPTGQTTAGQGQQPSWTAQPQQHGQFGQQQNSPQGHQSQPGWNPQNQQGSSQQGQQGQQGWGPQSQFTGQHRPSGQGTDPFSTEAPRGTPTAVKLGIVGALVGIIVFFGIGLAVSGSREKAPDELSAALAEALGEKTFDCESLGEQAVTLSESDTDVLVSTTGLTPTKDRRSTVELPDSGETVALACKGDGEWSDGATETIELELRLDSDGEAWVYYSQR